jgi:hypothetical protein
LTVALQVVRVEVVKGTPGAGAPALTQSASIWEAPLAQVSLATSYTQVLDANITDERVSAKQIGAQEGGTGIFSYTAGNLLVADTASSFEKLAPPTQYDRLGYSSLENGLMKWIDSRPTFIGGAADVNLSPTSFTIIPMDVSVDPAGNITSLAANVLTLEAGDYFLFDSTFPIFSTNVTGGQARLQNTSSAVEITNTQMILIKQANANGHGAFIPTVFSTDGTETYELQAVRSGAFGPAFGGVTTNAANTAFAYGFGIVKIGEQ